MVKKTVSLAIIAALSVSLLAGCGTKKVATNTTKKVTLTLWEQAATKTQVQTDLEASFMKKYPNIKLNIVEQADMGTSAYLSAIAAGNAPSVMGGGYPTAMAYIYDNAVMPIDDYIAKTPDFKNFVKDQVENFLVNGKHYAIPTGKYTMGFLYNKPLFTAAGITAVPTTWDELEADAKKLTIPAKQQYGFGLDGTQWASWHLEQFVWEAGGDLSKKNADGTATLTFDDPAVLTAANFYRKLKAEKVIQSNANAQINDLLKDFANGKSGFIVSGLQSMVAVTLVGMGMKSEDIGFFANPKGPSGKTYSQIGGDVMMVTVTKDKAVEDAAWTYLMYMNSHDSADKNLKDQASKGPIGAGILSRTDLKNSDYGAVNAELQKAMDDSNAVGHNEYYAKGAVGSVADDAVAKWFADPSVDVVKTMKAAQDAANAKELKDFNAGVLAAKK
ncbi:MAG TPA: extracellular solute-binding protein [Ruminiclostridium sp.]